MAFGSKAFGGGMFADAAVSTLVIYGTGSITDFPSIGGASSITDSGNQAAGRVTDYAGPGGGQVTDRSSG